MRRNAFTLIELLVVVSIIALLIAILLPVLRGSKHETKRMICKSNMHQAVIGLTSYAVDNDGLFPDGPQGRWDPVEIAKTETDGFGSKGAGFYDHRDLMRSYSGAQLNDILKCPLADQWWFEAEGGSKMQDIDRYNMGAAPRVVTPYSFFYGSTPPAGGATNRFERDQDLVSLEGGFIPKNQDLEFPILMADYTRKVSFGGKKLLTTHQPIGGKKGGGNMQSENRATAYLPGEQASANFALTDGSVVSYWLDFEATETDAFTAMSSFVLPVDLAR